MKLAQGAFYLCVSCIACDAYSLASYGSSIRGSVGQIQQHGSQLPAEDFQEDDPSSAKALFALINAAMVARSGAQFDGKSQLLAAGQDLDSLLSLVGNLLKEVVAANNETQIHLESSAADVGTCQHPYANDGTDGSSDASSATESEANTAMSIATIDEATRVEKKCREDLAAKKEEVQQCGTELEALTEAEEIACKVGEEDLNLPEACESTSDENIKTWIIKWKAHYEDKLANIKAPVENCKDIQSKLEKKSAPAEDAVPESCAYLKAEEEDKAGECDKLEAELQRATCNYVDELHKSCKSYKVCIEGKTEALRLVIQDSRYTVHAQQLEWRLLKRAECLAGATSDGKVQQEKLEKCANVTEHDTSHLDLRPMDVPGVPLPTECTVDAPLGLNSTRVDICKDTLNLGQAASGGLLGKASKLLGEVAACLAQQGNCSLLDAKVVRIQNAQSLRVLYASKGHNWESHVGAGKMDSGDGVGADGWWILKYVGSDAYGDRFRIVNEVSKRELYAAIGKTCGKKSGAGITPGEDGDWRFVEMPGNAHHYEIVNAHSGRKLYAKAVGDWGSWWGANIDGLGNDRFWRLIFSANTFGFGAEKHSAAADDLDDEYFGAISGDGGADGTACGPPPPTPAPTPAPAPAPKTFVDHVHHAVTSVGNAVGNAIGKLFR